ncbi:helix-turn-helix domain-containing protein [Hymenobacter metallicola]|uniref:Helix-turn-helix domain-containing protein n=1 Tax=Hymenobacter metallicola TaxID=2563114 RepID=A0A4Z0QKQ4_9BACT|nr:hypothetical protein [Hymenobacter metallicola]TGE29839.1 hypothetical protein E5K02_10370 [Hymenobacter metallicola]
MDEKPQLKGGLRQIHKKETVYVNAESGELLGSTTSTVKVQSKSKDDFGFLYRAGMLLVVALAGVAPQLYMWCLVNAQNGKGYLLFGAREREELCQLLKCSGKSVQRALAELVKAGLLTRASTGRYVLVAEYGWRGKAAGRKELVTESSGYRNSVSNFEK